MTLDELRKHLQDVPVTDKETRLVLSVEISIQLQKLSNEELTDRLLKHVWSDMDICTYEAELVSAAIERLAGSEKLEALAGKV